MNTYPVSKLLVAFLIALFSVPVLMSAQTNPGTLEVSMERGTAYSLVKQIGLGQTTVGPHLAVWLQTTGGTYVATIYVSLKDGKQDFWVGSRPHPLPVWDKLSKNSSLADAVTSSSPAPLAPTVLAWKRPWKWGNDTLVVRAEVNLAFDYNKSYLDDGKNVWGQPALEYAGTIGPESTEVKLTIIGSAMQDGTWQENISGITSGKDIVSSITARLK